MLNRGMSEILFGRPDNVLVRVPELNMEYRLED